MRAFAPPWANVAHSESAAPRRLFGALFGAAVLTVGLTEYRPVLGGIGNLSDCLFLAAFILSTGIWFARIDGDSIARLWRHVRNLEVLILGGIGISVGGALASLGSEVPTLSWTDRKSVV